MIIDTPHGPTLGWWIDRDSDDEDEPESESDIDAVLSTRRLPARYDRARRGRSRRDRHLGPDPPERGRALYVASLELAWWDGRMRHCEWVEPHEVTPITDDDDKPIGFQP